MDDFSDTARSYTLRLKGVDEGDRTWFEKLWKTHEIVNRGTKAWGNWLLTCRGGLGHDEIAGTQEETRSERRILLALSWLSVESKDGAPKEYIVKEGETIEVLRAILKSRGVEDKEVENWVGDCKPSLSASIRDDAVWVNRSKAFDKAREEIGKSLSREEVWDFLGKFFGKKEDYFKPVKISKDGSKVKSAKDHAKKAGNWLSNRFGPGKGCDYEKLMEECSKIAKWAADAGGDGQRTIGNLAAALGISDPTLQNLAGILERTKSIGSQSTAQKEFVKCLEETTEEAGEGMIGEDRLNDLRDKASKWEAYCLGKKGRKCKKIWADRILDSIEKSLGSKFTYNPKQGSAKHWQFAVILDHAARRVSATHTWIKRAEAMRREFEKNSLKMNEVPEDAKKWLENYCEERSEALGATEGYRIKPGAVDEWEGILEAWKNCETEGERIAAARARQGESEKFGDIQLFEALAADDAISVWRDGGESNSKILSNYVAAVEAKFNKKRFKVPAYRHPDPLLHPVFCDYGKSRWSISYKLHKPMKPRKGDNNEATDVHRLKMELWNGEELENVCFRWESKLFGKDISSQWRNNKEGEQKTVSRASRMGRAAAGINWETPVRISSISDMDNWNGRLQVSRDELDRIARRIEKHGWDEKAISRRRALKWFVTFSPKLKPQGPWLTYVKDSKDKTPFYIKDSNKKYKIGLHFGSNKGRKGSACLVLPRLPGLRILSIDLGQRHAAACAVWETLSSKQMKDACEKEDRSKAVPDAMYLHIKSDRHKCTVYRRIGSDNLPDGSPHPAPWARLERQFLIRLQGEERSARRATADEIGRVAKLEKKLGSVRPPTDKLVDKLMNSAVKTIRSVLLRHSDRARIAHYLVRKKETKPGGRKVKLDQEGRSRSIADALLIWYKLAMGRQDSKALELWKKHIEPRLPDGKLPDIAGGYIASKEMKKRKEELKKKLIPVAGGLLSLAESLSNEWHDLWGGDDKELREQLRWLRDWILPRGARKKEKSIRNVGGLSLDRLGTVKSLYQAHKAYFTRYTPNGPQLKDDKPITAGRNFGKHILDDMERMREQRVKQLSSRIVEAALGRGRIKTPKKGGDSRRPIEQVNAPCHAVVIENLTHYRPEQTRTRRENRQLMSWSAAKVKKYLLEGCTLHGLLLREVSASHTSRQDSRTGAPGLRCEDVLVKKFLKSSFWQKKISRVEKKTGAIGEYLLGLKKRWENSVDNATLLRIPNEGGKIFVSANGDSPASKGLQADLNAAANIGLKAITDPDWTGGWWYVPCNSKNFKPHEEKVKGSLVFKDIEALTVDSVDREKSKSVGRKKQKDKEVIINLWRDPSCKFSKTGWKGHAEYWKDAEDRVIAVIRRLNQQVVW